MTITIPEIFIDLLIYAGITTVVFLAAFGIFCIYFLKTFMKDFRINW